MIEFPALRSGKDLDAFVNYCIEHPTQRFWQALTNWTGCRVGLDVNDNGCFIEPYHWESTSDFLANYKL